MNLNLATIADITRQFVDAYKRKLMDANKKASGELISGIDQLVEFDGRYVIVSLRMPEQWKYVEYGRNPGKFPPVDAIKRWISVKPILPRPVNGKVPTPDQLAFLIGRKIARDGIPAGNYLNDTITEFKLIDKLKKELSEQIYGEISTQFLLDDNL